MIPPLSNKWLQRCLIAYGIIEIISMCSAVMQLDLLGAKTISKEAADSNDQRVHIIAIVNFIAYVTTAIVFSCWIVRAHRTVRAFGATAMTITPGWAVGYYFIPFVNLVRPYTAMKELWRASVNPVHAASQITPGLLPLWWTLWILAGVAGNISFRISNGADSISMLKVATLVDMISAGLSVFLTLAALKLVHDITTNVRALTAPPSLPPTDLEPIVTPVIG